MDMQQKEKENSASNASVEDCAHIRIGPEGTTAVFCVSSSQR